MEIVGEVVEDLVGGLAPGEGAGVLVPVLDPTVDVAASSLTDPNGVAVSGTTNFEFSNVGGPIEIVAPE